MKNNKKDNPDKKVLECTIDPNLFAAWQRLKRAKDAERICEKYNWSRPTVDNALNHGHVKQTELVDHINEFFGDRLKKEKKAAEDLLALANQ